MATEAEAGGGTKPSITLPPNVVGISTFTIGPWHVMLVGEIHLKVETPAEKSVLQNYFKYIMNTINNESRREDIHLCIDWFVEEPLKEEHLLRNRPDHIPHIVRAHANQPTSNWENNALLQGGGIHTIRFVDSVFWNFARKNHFTNIKTIRRHKADLRFSFTFARFLNSAFRNQTAYQTAIIGLPAIKILTDTEYDSDEIKRQIISNIINKIFFDFSSEEYANIDAGQIADNVIKQYEEARQQIDKEFDAIHLPDAIKKKLRLQELFNVHRDWGLETNTKLQNLLQHASSWDNVTTISNQVKEKIYDDLLSVEMIVMDAYTFYRMLKSYDPIHPMSQAQPCPPFNQYCILFAGDAHRVSIALFFQYLDRVIHETTGLPRGHQLHSHSRKRMQWTHSLPTGYKKNLEDPLTIQHLVNAFLQDEFSGVYSDRLRTFKGVEDVRSPLALKRLKERRRQKIQTYLKRLTDMEKINEVIRRNKKALVNSKKAITKDLIISLIRQHPYTELGVIDLNKIEENIDDEYLKRLEFARKIMQEVKKEREQQQRQEEKRRSELNFRITRSGRKVPNPRESRKRKNDETSTGGAAENEETYDPNAEAPKTSRGRLEGGIYKAFVRLHY